MSMNPVLLTLSGRDHPGVPADLLESLRATRTEVLDAEQIVIRGELVLCLLEAQGDKFSELGNKPDDNMPYNMVHPCYAGTLLKHTGTDFKALWTHQSCEVDNVFSPTLMFTPTDHSLDTLVASFAADFIDPMAWQAPCRT